MIHRHRGLAALLIAISLAGAPAAIDAADATLADPTGGRRTPLGTNLLRNSGFDTASTQASIPGWTAVGDVHVERFGTRSWPSEAYGRKWGGGKRYLACRRESGLVRQRIHFAGWSDRSFRLRARLQADFGGTSGHSIRVAIRVTGSGPDAHVAKRKVLDVTNHYKRVVTSLRLPLWAEHIDATVQLIRKDGAARCRMVADTLKLTVFRP